MSSRTQDQTDQLVLGVLREIAKDGTEGRVKGKPVRLAEPKDGDCVYMRIALEAERRGDVTLDINIFSHARELEESLRRLINRDLVFNNGGGATAERSFWVVIS
ncbi:MAG TPA: hypothetical protein VLG36_00685 [Candidatus Chromulinivoraceae bacterium]|nr:hypothetical protein [Candidatus Chromulinivoraceae bacterium]